MAKISELHRSSFQSMSQQLLKWIASATYDMELRHTQALDPEPKCLGRAYYCSMRASTALFLHEKSCPPPPPPRVLFPAPASGDVETSELNCLYIIAQGLASCGRLLTNAAHYHCRAPADLCNVSDFASNLTQSNHDKPLRSTCAAWHAPSGLLPARRFGCGSLRSTKRPLGTDSSRRLCLCATSHGMHPAILACSN